MIKCTDEFYKKITSLSEGCVKSFPGPQELKAIINEMYEGSVNKEEKEKYIKAKIEQIFANLLVNGRCFFERNYSFERESRAYVGFQEEPNIDLEIIDKLKEIGYVVRAEKFGYMISLP